jgi:hypothetical protein
MRTKVLICAAALAAASAFTSMAQSVYSLNVVGYINIPLVEGFQLIANQLDFDGTGTNNTVSNVLGTNLPLKSTVYTWNGSTYLSSSYAAPKGGGAAVWNPSITLNPGQGAWLSIPAGGLVGMPTNLTTVGQVDQGSLVNPNLLPAGGFSLVSSMVPVSGGLQTVLNYTPLVGDTVYQYSSASQSYLPSSSYSKPKGGGNPVWSPSEPSIAISQGFWLSSGAGAVWSNYFIVQ